MSARSRRPGVHAWVEDGDMPAPYPYVDADTDGKGQTSSRKARDGGGGGGQDARAILQHLADVDYMGTGSMFAEHSEQLLQTEMPGSRWVCRRSYVHAITENRVLKEGEGGVRRHAHVQARRPYFAVVKIYENLTRYDPVIQDERRLKRFCVVAWPSCMRRILDVRRCKAEAEWEKSLAEAGPDEEPGGRELLEPPPFDPLSAVTPLCSGRYYGSYHLTVDGDFVGEIVRPHPKDEDVYTVQVETVRFLRQGPDVRRLYAYALPRLHWHHAPLLRDRNILVSEDGQRADMFLAGKDGEWHSYFSFSFDAFLPGPPTAERLRSIKKIMYGADVPDTDEFSAYVPHFLRTAGVKRSRPGGKSAKGKEEEHQQQQQQQQQRQRQQGGENADSEQGYSSASEETGSGSSSSGSPSSSSGGDGKRRDSQLKGGGGDDECFVFVEDSGGNIIVWMPLTGQKDVIGENHLLLHAFSRHALAIKRSNGSVVTLTYSASSGAVTSRPEGFVCRDLSLLEPSRPQSAVMFRNRQRVVVRSGILHPREGHSKAYSFRGSQNGYVVGGLPKFLNGSSPREDAGGAQEDWTMAGPYAIMVRASEEREHASLVCIMPTLPAQAPGGATHISGLRETVVLGRSFLDGTYWGVYPDMKNVFETFKTQNASWLCTALTGADTEDSLSWIGPDVSVISDAIVHRGVVTVKRICFVPTHFIGVSVHEDEAPEDVSIHPAVAKHIMPILAIQRNRIVEAMLKEPAVADMFLNTSSATGDNGGEGDISSSSDGTEADATGDIKGGYKYGVDLLKKRTFCMPPMTVKGREVVLSFTKVAVYEVYAPFTPDEKGWMTASRLRRMVKLDQLKDAIKVQRDGRQGKGGTGCQIQ